MEMDKQRSECTVMLHGLPPDVSAEELKGLMVRYCIGPHSVHSHTVHLPLGALLTWCTMCVAQVRYGDVSYAARPHTQCTHPLPPRVPSRSALLILCTVRVAQVRGARQEEQGAHPAHERAPTAARGAAPPAGDDPHLPSA